MIDVSYFQNSTSNTQLFQNGGTWQTWVKPRGAKIVNFFVVGAGSGGGGGFRAATGNKSGGASGGNGGNTKLTVQASILPDILYVLTGTGGEGGIGGNPATAGGAATKSFVSLTPNTGSISNIVCTSGGVAAVGGAAGSTVNTSTTLGEQVATTSNMIFANLGNFLSTGGATGPAGQITSAFGSPLVQFNLGGGGGGGTGTGGTTATGVGPFPGIPSTPINTSGTNGLIFYKPIFGVSGGCGGGGGTTGGKGGNGAPGCGGGGGGAGTVSAGSGGRGGDGFVIITTNF